MQVNILEAKNRLSQLVKAAQSGHEVVIANRGVPVARLVPAEGQDDAPAVGSGRARDILEWLDRNPLPAHARRSREEIEAGVRDERAAWE